MFEKLPYTNFHDLNLDWIIEVVKDFLSKYNHIQELIDTGISDIQKKADEMQAMLDEWYETHSDQLARQLAQSLDDLNEQYNINVTEFIQQADEKAAQTIASIPADYSALSADVANLKKLNAFNLTPARTGSETNRGVTFDWNTYGGCHVHGTNDGTSYSSSNIFHNTTQMPDGLNPGGSYFRKFEAPSNMRLQVLGYDAAANMTVIDAGDPGSGSFTIPSNIVGMTIRLLVTVNSTVNTTVYPIISSGLSNSDLSYNQIDVRPIVEAIQDDVDQLKLHEMTLNLSSASNINSANMWEQGSISPVTGENAASSSRIRTVGFLQTNVASMELPDDTRGFFIVGYDQDNNFLGVYNNDGIWTIDQGSGFQSFNFSIIYYKYNNVKLRVYLYSRDGTDITIDEAENIVMRNIYNQLLNPVKIRIMQYNIGQFNFGHDGGYSGSDIGLKLSNYRKFMYNYHPDIVALQEYRDYVDSEDRYNANDIIFSYVKPFKSYEEHGYILFGNYEMNGFRHTYLHTAGDYPVRMVYGTIIVNNKEIAIGTAALNSLGGSADAAMKKRALAKMMDILSRYENAIIGIDANPESSEEAESIKAYLKENKYMCANWDYSAYYATYNPSSSQYKYIDNIFIKGKARFQNVFMPPVSEYGNLLSDHLPLIADIVLYK